MPESVLFLPGLLCDTRLWRDQIAALSDIAHATVADLTRDDSVDDMARHALQGMPDRFALCGLSMGGYVALALMRLAPDRVTRLCLMDTSARPDSEEQARRRRGLIAMTRAHRFRGVTPRLLPMLIHPARQTDTALTQEVMDMAERVGRDAFLRQQNAILHRPDSRPHLPAINVPTRVAVGSDDQLTPPDHAREIAAGIPGAILHVVSNSGHLPPMERPDEVSEILRDWLAEAL
ncbi:alpha/beta fold hydrolase [Rhodovastum sp. RN2-1]|uniref:Alpha/beta fold hydrolase n=2 Tax=Limobrevibacterium gyesilva TaxID=2991712 RepID=A0AA41YKR9_9PROT|nr:alpha/beta fold hydrolase [Limobrevibacterium gyesilva]MCW3475164.1 alpha/beta fold hydrolase [Limobrevibacterium gyesilva]